LELAKHNPAAIYFSGRSAVRGAAVIEEAKAVAPSVEVTFIALDLASLATVVDGVREFMTGSSRLDILMCNAGVMALPPGLTADGYEVQFGTNHVGHALLVKLLLPTLLRTSRMPGAEVRVVFNTSLGFRGHPSGGVIFEDLKSLQDFKVAGAWVRYGQSKIANILYAAELARRHPEITAVSVHPGVVRTGLVSDLSFLNRALVYVTNVGCMKTLQQGTYNQLWAATVAKERIVNGEFYEPVGVRGRHDKTSKNEKLAEELWEWTEKELELYKL
jgi:NAD(P)-dependent dehydrogenase (short-subunit alcohol dehydrogenase family)